MSLQNVQVEFAELIIANEQATDLVKPRSNLIVYQQNLVSHLTRALQNAYPLLFALLGESAFKTAARDYITQYPSSSGNLDEYGVYFSDFLSRYEPAAPLTYLPEVATFEWIAHTLQRAPDAIPFDPNRLKKIAIEHYGHLEFMLNPACQLHTFYYPITDIIELCRGHIEKLDALNKKPLYLLMQRQESDITLTTITEAEFIFLHAVNNSHVLTTALELALNVDPDFNLNEKLTEWIKNNTIVDFHLAT